MSDFPKELMYTKEHEWAKQDGDVIWVGITSYAVEQLGDITLVDLPEVGSAVNESDRFGDIESVKTVSELFAPASGEVVEINAALEDEPEVINEDPYEKGWMVKIKITESQQLDALMNVEEYETYVSGLDH